MKRSRLLGLVPVLLTILAACGQASPSVPLGEVTAALIAGPVCPVETVPPDPNCAARPVADREVVVLGADGREVARGRSDAEGIIRFQLPYGSYLLRAPSDDGFPIPPADESIVVDATPLQVELAFDTGIR
jgi:hypothetical protein